MPNTRPVVVIDPGHGGSAKVGGSSPNNATGPNGLLEKNLTLDLAQRVAPLLAAQARVILTRTSDINLGLAARAQVARDHNAALFMSIHLNGWHDPAVDGTTLYIARRPNQRSRDFAQTLADRLSAVTGVRNRGVHQKDFGVLLPSRHAPQTGACLVEVAFLTNPQQARRLEQEAYRQQLAEAMAEAIRRHLPEPVSATHSFAEAWTENTATALQSRPPSWELPANFPTQIRDFWRAPASRLHHFYWHLARMNWNILSTAEKTDIQTFGFSAPPRLAGTRTRSAVAGAGLDFLHMHRQMVEATRALISTHRLAYRLRGWNPVPWNHRDSIWPMPPMSVTPAPPFKTQAVTDDWQVRVRDRYWNDRWLAGVTLDALGTQIEEGIHNWFHMHWATDPPANVATSDWLGDPFSSAANPAFWKLHGWIDELMARWERANTRARTGRTVAGALRNFTPWLGPVPRVTTPTAGTPPASKSLAMIAPGHHGRFSPEDLQARIARIDFSRWNLFPFANLTLEELRERFGSPNRAALVAGMDLARHE